MFYSTPKKERLCQRKFSDKHTIFFLQSGGCIQNSSIKPPFLRARLGTPPAAAARPLPPRAPPRPPRRTALARAPASRGLPLARLAWPPRAPASALTPGRVGSSRRRRHPSMHPLRSASPPQLAAPARCSRLHLRTHGRAAGRARRSYSCMWRAALQLLPPLARGSTMKTGLETGGDKR